MPPGYVTTMYHPSPTLSGFGSKMTLSADFATMPQYAPFGAGTQGALIVRDHDGDTARITLVGAYLAANHSASSGTGSTLIGVTADLLGGTLITITHELV